MCLKQVWSSQRGTVIQFMCMYMCPKSLGLVAGMTPFQSIGWWSYQVTYSSQETVMRGTVIQFMCMYMCPKSLGLVDGVTPFQSIGWWSYQVTHSSQETVMLSKASPHIAPVDPMLRRCMAAWTFKAALAFPTRAGHWRPCSSLVSSSSLLR